MGACFSCKPSQTSFSNSVRVVHLNGLVEVFEYNVSVSEVIGKLTKHFVCTPAQLLSTGSRPLKPETLLEPGQIYLLLPFSALQADVSPLDLVSLVKKLTAIAKSGRCEAYKSSGASPSLRQNGSSPARSWKPKLDPIRERSFNRRSESDLQESSYLEVSR
ncbi:hypothetical protein UlMin_004690 [Ulmus minor]